MLRNPELLDLLRALNSHRELLKEQTRALGRKTVEQIVAKLRDRVHLSVEGAAAGATAIRRTHRRSSTLPQVPFLRAVDADGPARTGTPWAPVLRAAVSKSRPRTIVPLTKS